MVTVSSRRKFSISRDGGATWLDFPKMPNGFPQPLPMVEPMQRTNGTKAGTMFYTLELQFSVLTPEWWLKTVNLYNAQQQEILFNYRGLGYDIVNGGLDYQERWYYAPAIFADMPTATPGGPLYRDATVRFTHVEYFIPGGLS